MSDKQPVAIDSLPEIGAIEIPPVKVMSTKIRWLAAMGYKPADISRYLMVRYQQVRNVITTQPKRAAREDLPELKLVLKEPVDDIQAIMDAELEKSLRAGRKIHRANTDTQENSED